ncbi:universal stress protein UspA [Pollutimonas subterranea]|uniref:Universal stress protein UspA n=1 Tax=Pollutimonas subterranea TaxID=2045210 RepID=A0A2N4U4I4_9BURK|nr:universal stress protein [Pollutimonas subterranea]PLC49931.1 universal stress protein UspA [Pollutimonas subterranea]
MLKILVPVDGSSNSLHAVLHVVNEFRKNAALEIHLLNVQTPFSQYVSRFVSRRDRHDFHRDQAELALLPSRQMLDRFGVPYEAHMELGEKAYVITDAARRLHCDHIVVGAARKSSLIRMVENSTINKVIELTTVPVKVVAGDPVSPLERYGIPAGVGTGLASLFFAAAE